MNAHSKTGKAPQFISRLGLTALTTAGVVVAAGSAAQAEIITKMSGLTTSTAPDTTASDGNDIFFSFATGQAQKAAFDGYQYRLTSTVGSDGTSKIANLDTATTDGTNSYLADCNSPAKLTNGSTISSTLGENQSFMSGYGGLSNSSGPVRGNTLYPWSAGETGYLGFQFGSNGNYNYGWADITVGSDYNVTLNQFAYEDTPNQAITAGAGAIVPEANPLELLLLGAAGLGAYRLLQKKRETTAAA